MKSKIVVAFIVVTCIIGILIALIIVFKSSSANMKFMYENILISFEENQAIEEIYFEKKGYINNIKMPLQITNFDKDTMKVMLDDKEVRFIGGQNISDTCWIIADEKLCIYEIDNLADEIHKITVKYPITTDVFVKEYNNIDVIDVKYTNYMPYKNIKITLPQKTDKFTTSEEKITFTKQSETQYILNTKDLNKDLKIFVDKGVFLNAKKININYEEPASKKNEQKTDNVIKNINLIVPILTIFNLIIIYFITKRRKNKKNYNREIDTLVDPTLAEVIIDGKINAKDLIMSVIVEQIEKKNIYINNDELTLIKLDEDISIKGQIVKMFFDQKGQTIKIKDISKVFKDDSKIDSIIELFKDIKNKITKKLYDLNIYSASKRKLLEVLKIFSVSFIVEIIGYLIYLLFGIEFLGVILKIISIVGIFIFLSFIVVKSNLFPRTLEKTEIIVLLTVPIFITIFFLYELITSFLPKTIHSINMIELIYLISGIIANIVIIILSKRHVFTKNGLAEYEKAKGLYNYLIDYSLIKERDINSTIIWDEYLVYATSFGIPSKVTNIFSEELMNVADTLNKINSIII